MSRGDEESWERAWGVGLTGPGDVTCIGFSIHDRAVDCMLAVERHSGSVFQQVFFVGGHYTLGPVSAASKLRYVLEKKIIPHSCVGQASIPV